MGTLFSVIIPTKDPNIALLKDALDSVRNQTAGKIEIIIVAFLTNPSQQAELSSLLVQNERLIVTDLRGISNGRNIGLNESSGDYIVFLDDDDRLSPFFFEACQQAIDDTSADLICFQYSINENAIPSRPTASLVIEGNEATRNLFLGFRNPGKPTDVRCVWAKAFSAQVLRENSIRFRTDVFDAEDVLFCQEYALASERCVCYPKADEFGYFYRQREGSVTYRYNPKAIETFDTFLKAYSDLLLSRSIPFEDFYYHICNQIILNVALSYIFNIENPASFHSKKKELKDLSNRPFYKEAIRATPTAWMITKKKKILLWFLKRHFYIGAALLLYARYNRRTGSLVL